MNQTLIVPANFSASGITVEIAPPVEETASIVVTEETAAFTIPAGQRFVEIYVAGLVVDGDTEGPATIMGETLNVGDTYKFVSESQIDKVFLSPAVTGDGNGARLFIKYWS